MAEEDSGQDRSEEATPERRDEFRERGEITISREVTSVLMLMGTIIYLTSDFTRLVNQSRHFFAGQFIRIGVAPMGIDGFLNYAMGTWLRSIELFLPIGCVAAATAIASTFAQSRLSFSWKKISPDFARLNPWAGLKRMINTHAVMELTKSTTKMFVIGTMAYLILLGEWKHVPSLMFFSMNEAWAYWAEITRLLVWAVVSMTFVIAGGDFFFNFLSLERRLKMTKQEIKEEYKKREVDPHVKGRMRRMQRDMAQAKAIRATKSSTVVITNPTHYAVAIKYTAGLKAPKVVAKGVDFLALRMREIATEAGVPIVENPPLARTLYKAMEVGQDIPESLWVAVSEVIRYVIKLKGWNYVRQNEA